MSTSRPKSTVLLVEDSDDDAFFFGRAFVKAAVPGRLVRLADGRAALDYLRRAAAETEAVSDTHIMFLDLKLPLLSGFDVLRWIQERALPLEVVVLSGSDILSDKETARSLGASDYLVKPISAEELRKRFSGRECELSPT